MLLPILGVVAAYLIGSIPFGYVVARAKGVDIFKAGSGNIGATNVSRVLGRKYGLLVFALDVLKGALPTAIMRALITEPAWAVAAGLAAMLGHLFPIYLRFRGGKGVATGFGVVAVLLPVPAAIAFLVWLAVVASTRYVSLASIVAVVALVAARLLGTQKPFSVAELPVTAFCLATGLLVIVKHRANIRRLVQGKENRVTESKKLQTLARVLHVVALGLWVGGAVMFSFVVAPSVFATLDAPQAGAIVAPIFPPYFAIQGICGLVAVATAAGWAKLGLLHRMRFSVLCLAVILVLAGWPIVGRVAELREARSSADAAVAAAARASFGIWHGISLSLNLLTLALAAIGLVLAAYLPLPRLTDEHDSL
jgi:acyl phosphate:glycerol-3-phosphate acyltransferase